MTYFCSAIESPKTIKDVQRFEGLLDFLGLKGILDGHGPRIFNKTKRTDA
ncbi:MAG: hypothetical protein WAK17_24535 [Candidatus Nitrosopolaris sp.]